MKQAVFFDRDGVINELIYNREHGTIDSPLNSREIKLVFGIEKLIKFLNGIGFKVIIISNQPAIGLGKTTLENHEKIQKKIEQLLKKSGARIDYQYYCFHHPFAKVKKYKKDCNCRKPKIGLFKKAAKELDIDLKKSWMIGDGVTDIKAGEKAGCKTILLANIKHSENLSIIEKQLGRVHPNFMISKPLEAITMIKDNK